MKLRRWLVAALLVAGGTAAGGTAAGECICRAPQLTAVVGQTVCLATPRGPRLARCEKVLNNTAWRFLARSCAASAT